MDEEDVVTEPLHEQDVRELDVLEAVKLEEEAVYTELLQIQIGDRQFLLPVHEVAEIIRPLPLTPVPMGPDHLLGMANVRGQIVCVIDPGSSMHLMNSSAESTADTRYLVLRHRRMHVAIRIDRISAIHHVNEEDIPVNRAEDGSFSRGEMDVAGERLELLDAEALLH